MPISNELSEKIYKALHERHAVQRYLARKSFRVFQRLGLHVVGDHFYEPIPNTRSISRSYLDEPRPCLGIDFDWESSERYLKHLVSSWGGSFFASASRLGYLETNYYFNGLDALTLYCLIREISPSRVVEIGQGMSSRVIAAALGDNYQTSAVRPSFISIDPYARVPDELQIHGVDFRLIRKEIQSLSDDLDEVLSADLLFVDSSHVHKFGSDVAFLFDKVYPRVESDTIIHIHDVFTPYEYPFNWYVHARRFWNEQHHLENFLRFNPEFELLLPVHWLSRESDGVQRAATEACPHPGFSPGGGSFYLRRRNGKKSWA